MNKIKNKKLQKIIKFIDSTKFKKKSLERQLEGDQDFKLFIDEILTHLGLLKNKTFTY
jgi:hypothetical protein